VRDPANGKDSLGSSRADSAEKSHRHLMRECNPPSLCPATRWRIASCWTISCRDRQRLGRFIYIEAQLVISVKSSHYVQQGRLAHWWHRTASCWSLVLISIPKTTIYIPRLTQDVFHNKERTEHHHHFLSNQPSTPNPCHDVHETRPKPDTCISR
jgi:hypothetical protein